MQLFSLVLRVEAEDGSWRCEYVDKKWASRDEEIK